MQPDLIKKLPTQFRTVVEIERGASPREADGAIPCSLSSETPVDRWYGQEILDHSKNAVDMSRAQNGLPLLLDHDTGVQIGRIVDLEVKNKKLRGFMRFSRSQAAQEVRQDVLDGIRGEMSIGYRVREMLLEASDDSGETYRITQWTPLEGSLVPVPADETVGAGREAEGAAFPVKVTAPAPVPPAAPATTRTAMDTPAPAPAAAAPVVDIKGGVENERKRTREITALAMEHGLQARLDEWLGSDITPDAVARTILAEKRAQPRVVPSGTAAAIGAEQEIKRYSVIRALNIALAMAEGSRVDNCLELEFHDEFAKRQGKAKHGGLLFPVDLPIAGKRTGLDSKTTSAGLELKFTEPGSFIEVLRNSAKVMSLGATFLPGLQGNVAFPRQTAAGTFSWQAENPGSDVSDSNLTLDQVTISPKFGMSSTSYSRNLLAQAVVDIEALVRNDLALITAIGIDLAAINGLGASNQPKGILQQSGIGSVTEGANGGSVSWNDLVNLEKTVEAANALRGSLAYLTTPGQKAKMKQIAQISATTGIPVWWQGEVNGYRAEASTNVPSTLTKGTSTTICHAIIFGNWAEVIIGQWNALELVVDPYRLKKQAMIEVTSYVSVDVALRHAASMAAIQDAL